MKKTVSSKRKGFPSKFGELTVTQKLVSINYLVKDSPSNIRNLYELVLCLPAIIAQGMLFRLIFNPRDENVAIFGGLLCVLTWVLYMAVTRLIEVLTLNHTRKQINSYTKNGEDKLIKRTVIKYGVVYYLFFIAIILVLMYLLKLKNLL